MKKEVLKAMMTDKFMYHDKELIVSTLKSKGFVLKHLNDNRFRLRNDSIQVIFSISKLNKVVAYIIDELGLTDHLSAEDSLNYYTRTID